MAYNIAIFASGGGSDMQSIIDSVERGEINGKVVLLVANKDNIGAIDRATKHAIPHVVAKLSDYPSHEARDEFIVKYLTELKVDIIVLAGYLSIVTDRIISLYNRRIINIHPSLIPRHCGKGYYGIKVHQSVIDSGDTISGATVHYVEVGVDTGEIIEQATVAVLEGDDASSLQARVLIEEHKLLPRVVAKLCK